MRPRKIVPPEIEKRLREIREQKQIPEKIWQSIKKAGGVEGTFVPPKEEETK